MRPTPASRPTTTRPAETARPTQATPSPGCHYSTKPHPSDCNAYYSCVSEEEVLRNCPFGLHWNRALEACDWPESAGCQKKSEMIDAEVVEMPKPVVRPTSKPVSKPAPGTIKPKPAMPVAIGDCNSGEYTEGPTCDQYYLCSNGGKMIQTCGPGLHWNNEKKLCDWPKEARCEVRSQSKDGK